MDGIGSIIINTQAEGGWTLVDNTVLFIGALTIGFDGHASAMDATSLPEPLTTQLLRGLMRQLSSDFQIIKKEKTPLAYTGVHNKGSWPEPWHSEHWSGR